MSEEESGAEEVAEAPADGEEQAPTGPKHEPFSFKLLSTVQSQQSANGLRHNDHLRYRQYCARRLRRLHNALKFHHGKGRWKPAPIPEDFQNVRYLEVPLINAERAWSYGVQLKADNAAASAMNMRWRHHSIQRFGKAVKWAKMLESLCKVHGDQRTQLEAEAYTAFLEGVFLVEKEQWSEAMPKIVRCRKVCEYLSLASGPEEATFLKAKAQELAPLLRECKFNLGMQYDADAPDEDDAKPSTPSRRDMSGLSYRSQGLAIPSDKIKGKLLQCLDMVSHVKVSAEPEESESVIEKYGQLSVEFSDVLKDIHGDMISAGADGQTSEWSMLESFAREFSISMNVERNLILLWNHFLKLEPLEEIASTESRRVCRPEEGMRFCDLLKEDLGSLRELPEANEQISAALAAYVSVVLNCRCFFLALCYTSLGKVLEAASLMDMLHARINDVALTGPLQDPLGRLHPLFSRLQDSMPAHVARWRCRGLAHLCSTATAAAPKQGEGGADNAGDSGQASAVPAKTAKSGGLEKADFVVFPPRFRDIPCKPLLFDLAFPTIQQPDIEQVLQSRSSAADGQQKGFLGRVAGVAGGLGNKLGGLWGRK